MSFLDPVLDATESLLDWLSIGLRQTTHSYCDLETAEDSRTLVAKDGSLLSVVHLDGARVLVGTQEFDQICAGFQRSLDAYLGNGSHAMQVHFVRDPSGAGPLIGQMLGPARETAKRLHLALDDLFKERESFLANWCAEERCYLTLWTRPIGLSSQESKRVAADRKRFYAEAKVPPMRNAQNPFAGNPAIRDRHASFVNALVSDLQSLNLSAETMDVHAALRQVRSNLDPAWTGPDWSPSLPGDPLPMRHAKKDSMDASDLLWLPLVEQLIPRDMSEIDNRTVKLGDRLYAPLYVHLPPKDPMPFIKLFSRTMDGNLPWRISFLVEGDGIKSLQGKALVASILSFASADNKLISNAYNELKARATLGGESVVKLRITMATWVTDGEGARRDEALRLLRKQASQLARAVEGWGGCEVREVSGDARQGLMSASLAISRQSVGTPAAPPLVDVVHMLPVARPSSPWATGANLFRSPDGKVWPYQPGSSQQTTWIDLIFARPGSGKSVLLNASNLALCLLPGIERLPRIAIIDIGPSSSGLVSLLKEALPADQQHLVAYHRLRMTPDFAINPFETQLGCRAPTPQERAFLVNFLTLLATPVGKELPYEGAPEMASLIVDEMYKLLGDGAGQRLYAEHIDPVVDARLADANLVIDKRTTWWEVVDALFAAGFLHEAGLAQRHAVPLLADTAAICRTQAVVDLYGEVKAPTGETLIDAFARMVSSAVRDYPILSQPTRFDLGDVRVVSLDLDEVAKSGGAAADRQTAVCYMLARYVMARHYYLTPENVTDMPPLYREHHRKRIAEIREDPKRICCDEFHRTSKARAVRDQIVVDMREGRKWGVQVTLLSQSIEDFDEVMVEFATSVYIMDAGPAQTIDKLTGIFGLSATARTALATRVHGPRRGGATFLAQFATKSGMNTQLLTSTLGPIELWAFSTTVDDVLIRNGLYRALGPTRARRLLAQQYPGGSAESEVLRRKNLLKDEGSLDDESAHGVIQQIINELIQVARSSIVA